jgi:hypothetical protein
MNKDKKDELIIHLLVNVKAEILGIKELLMGSYAIKKPDWTQQKQDDFEKEYTEKILDYQKSILAVLRSRYSDELGSVDDLLKDIFK